ncbi:MAG TPA: DUF3999 family protein [Acidobacteriaceae bacterium]|nr:DUF3999 family protein [Acidobacteriaceae bacterium]
MKLAAVVLLLAAAAPSPEIRYFRYQRPVLNSPQSSGQACLALDAAFFAHAAPGLADLRLYRGPAETPYLIRLAALRPPMEKPIPPMNLGRKGSSHGGQTVFDAAMPEGSYRELRLSVTAHDFIATVTVSGSQTRDASAQTRLGAYTIFDLSRQKLGRSTVLHLPESDFRYLHFQIAGPLSPENIAGLSVERLAAGQPMYQPVAKSSQVSQKGRLSVVDLTVPAHVPVDRIVFTPGPSPLNFSRQVSIAVTPLPPLAASDAAGPAQTVSFPGDLMRLHSVQSGHRIDEERLFIETRRAGLATPARWTITIDNGDDAALLPAVRLEMLERDLCFEAAGGGRYTLFYGDPALAAPRYDYAALFPAQANASQIAAGPEQQNPEYRSRPDQRPFTERHPALLWVALAGVIVLLGAIALEAAKRTKEPAR